MTIDLGVRHFKMFPVCQKKELNKKNKSGTSREDRFFAKTPTRVLKNGGGDASTRHSTGGITEISREIRVFVHNGHFG